MCFESLCNFFRCTAMILLIGSQFGSGHCTWGQTYIDKTSEWYGSSQAQVGGAEQFKHYHYKMTIGDDTLLSGKRYMKLIGKSISYSYSVNPEDSAVIAVPKSSETRELALLRVEKNVLYVRQLHTKTNFEEPYYELKLQRGDTTILNEYCGKTMTVDRVDEFWLGPEKRNIYEVEPSPYRIYEGIGSSLGVLRRFCTGMFIESGSALHCYTQDGHIANLTKELDCELVVASHLEVKITCDFTTFQPNRFSNHIRVDFDTDGACPKVIQVFDRQGVLQIEQKTEPYFDNIIDASGIAKGAYFVKAIYNDGYEVIRLGYKQ